MIRPEDLAGIPAEHRRVIARWLCERANSIRPSMFCTPSEAEAIGGVMYGVAVDLADPLADDSSVAHSAAVLATLGVEVRG
jgi:hypothetical protein